MNNKWIDFVINQAVGYRLNILHMTEPNATQKLADVLRNVVKDIYKSEPATPEYFVEKIFRELDPLVDLYVKQRCATYLEEGMPEKKIIQPFVVEPLGRRN